MRWRLGFALLAVLATAGCLGFGDGDPQPEGLEAEAQGSEEVDDASDAEPQPRGEDGELSDGETAADDGAGNRTREDVYLAEGRAGDPAAIRAFVWTIPDGAVQEHPEFTDLAYVPLQVVVDTGEAVDLGRLGVFFFDLDETASLTGSRVEVPHTVVERTATDEGTRDRGVEGGSFNYGLYDREAGDRVGIALAAGSPRPGSVDLAFRVLEGGDQDTDPDSVEALVDEAPSRDVRALERTGEGEGLHAARYREARWIDDQGVHGFARSSEDVEVVGRAVDLRPVSASGSIELASRFEADQGYSRMRISRLGTSSAGQWSAQASLHGVGEDAGGPFAAAHTYDLPAAVPYGLFGFSMVAEASGNGPGDVHATVDEVEADRFRFLSFSHVALGASTETLFGLSMEERASVDTLEDHVPPPIPDGFGMGLSLAGEQRGLR